MLQENTKPCSSAACSYVCAGSCAVTLPPVDSGGLITGSLSTSVHSRSLCPRARLCVTAFVLHVLDVDWLLSAAVYCVTPVPLSLATTMHKQKRHMCSGSTTTPSINGWSTYSWLSYFWTDSSVFWCLLGAAVHCWAHTLNGKMFSTSV